MNSRKIVLFIGECKTEIVSNFPILLCVFCRRLRISKKAINPLETGGPYSDPPHIFGSIFIFQKVSFDRFFLIERRHRETHSETSIELSALCFALHFRTLVKKVPKIHVFSPKPPTSKPREIFWMKRYQFFDIRLRFSISIRFPTKKTDRKKLFYFSS